MSIYKEILKHSLTYSVAVVLGKIASVLLLPLYTRYLSTSDYGVLELLDLTTFVVSILVGTHLSDAFLYYYSKAQDETERQRILSTAFLGATGVGFLVMLAAFVFAPVLSLLIFKSDRYAFYFRLVFANLVLVFPGEIATGELRFLRRSSVLMKVQVARLALAILFNVSFLTLFHFGMVSVLYSTILCSIFGTACLAIIGLSHVRLVWDARIFGSLFRYALPIGLSGIGMMVVNFGDRFFLQRAVSIGDIGIYSLAYKIGMLVSYVQWIFNMYWTSQMFRLLQTAEGERLYIRITTYFTLAMSLGWLGVSIFARPLLRILATPQYAGAALFVPGIAFAYGLRSLGEHFRSMIFVEKRPDIETRITIVGALVCLAAYSILIPRFTLFGAVAATVLAFLTMGLHGFWEAQRLRKSRFEYRRIATILFAAGSVYCLHLVFDPQTLPAQAAWAICCMGLYLGILAACRFFNPEERQLVRNGFAGVRAMYRAAPAGGR